MSKIGISFVSAFILFSTSVYAADSSFLKDAAEGGMLEVKMGELAQRNASDPQVKEFGHRMVTDHSNMGNNVKDLASRENVSLAADIGMKDKFVYERLSKKTGADFDKAYMADMVKDHKDDIAAFEKEANSGKDPEAKALAQKALPTLRDHLRMAQEVASKVGAPQ
jgi:putative membrane protein